MLSSRRGVLHRQHFSRSLYSSENSVSANTFVGVGPVGAAGAAGPVAAGTAGAGSVVAAVAAAGAVATVFSPWSVRLSRLAASLTPLSRMMRYRSCLSDQRRTLPGSPLSSACLASPLTIIFVSAVSLSVMAGK